VSMFKVIVDSGETKFGPSWTWLDMASRHVLSKVASSGVHVPPQLAEKIAELTGTLPRNKVAFYNRALGAFESFGLNRNGDGFEREWLQKKHATFVSNAHYFAHHKNNDPGLSRGRPIASAFNDQTDMVDLIIVADRDKCAEQIQALESGRRVPTSMGAKVAFDVCTIIGCGNRARNRSEYCEHVSKEARAPYGMCQVLPDGQVCGVLNPDPNFFDISDVIVGAAAESETLLKVASAHGVVSGAELGEIFGLGKWAEENKSADIVKRIPGSIDGYVTRGMARLSTSEPSIPDDVIDRAVTVGGFDGLVRTSAAMGIVLKPSEFSRAAKLGSFNAPTLTEILSSECAPKNILAGSPVDEVVSLLTSFYPHRSCHQPALVNRVGQAKVASVVHVDREDVRAKKMYVAYRASLLNHNLDDESEFVAMKLAGTNSLMNEKASRAYVMGAHLVPSNSVLDRVLDRAPKIANAGVVGKVSASLADDIGVETLDLITVQSLSK